jgi:hypothetical protein
VLTPSLLPYVPCLTVRAISGWLASRAASLTVMDLPPILHPKYCTQWGTPGNLVASRAKIVTLNLCTSQVPRSSDPDSDLQFLVRVASVLG